MFSFLFDIHSLQRFWEQVPPYVKYGMVNPIIQSSYQEIHEYLHTLPMIYYQLFIGSMLIVYGLYILYMKWKRMKRKEPYCYMINKKFIVQQGNKICMSEYDKEYDDIRIIRYLYDYINTRNNHTKEKEIRLKFPTKSYESAYEREQNYEYIYIPNTNIILEEFEGLSVSFLNEYDEKKSQMRISITHHDEEVIKKFLYHVKDVYIKKYYSHERNLKLFTVLE